jgi:hypothetical protein
MVGCIIQHYKRGLVQIGDQLISEPSHVIVAVENFVVVSKMVPLLLGAEGPDQSRHQPCFVLVWLLMRFHYNMRVWALDCGAEAVPPPLVLLLLVDDILVIIGVPEAVFIPVVVFMDVALIHAHLSEPLPWRLGSVSKECPEVVMLLGTIPGREDKISSALAAFIPTKLALTTISGHSGKLP